MTKNRKDIEFYKTQYQRISDLYDQSSWSLHRFLESILNLNREGGGIPIIVADLLDIIVDISLILRQGLSVGQWVESIGWTPHGSDRSFLSKGPGAYILTKDKSNPTIKFLPWSDEIGNPAQKSSYEVPELFWDYDLSKYFNSLIKQCMLIKDKLVHQERMSSSSRLDFSIKLHQDFVRFSQRIAELKRVCNQENINFLKQEKVQIDKQIARLAKRINRAVERSKVSPKKP